MASETMTTGAVIKNPIPKSGIIDVTKRMKLTTTEKHPFHKAGTEVNVAPAVADKYAANGWAK